jgi:large-conductance mechanosensitive channel
MIAASWGMEIKLAVAVLIGAALAVGIGALVKYLIDH